MIDRAAILGHARRLEVAAALGAMPMPMPTLASGGASASGRPPAAAPAAATPLAATSARLDEVVIARVERVLAETRGRIEGARGAAARLGVNPHTLRAKMRKLGIDWARFRDAD